MKNLKRVLPLIVFLVLSVQGKSQIGNSENLYNDGLMRYPEKSGVIRYKITGGASGTAILSFDQGGWLEHTERKFTFSLYGMKNEISAIEGQDGDTQFTIDLKSMRGTQMTNKTESGLMKYKNAVETRSAIYTSQGGVYTGDTTILGQTAKIWKFQNRNPLEIWEAEGLVLYQEKKIGNLIYQQIAVSIEDLINPIIIPENVEWKIND